MLSFSTHYFALKNVVYLVGGQESTEVFLYFVFQGKKKPKTTETNQNQPTCQFDHSMRQINNNNNNNNIILKLYSSSKNNYHIF